MSKMPIRVVVTGAAGQISYSLLGLIAKGDVFGQDQPVDLVMLDLPFAADAMAGVVMELQVRAFCEKCRSESRQIPSPFSDQSAHFTIFEHFNETRKSIYTQFRNDDF